MSKASRVSLPSVNIFKSSVDKLVSFSHNLPDAKVELDDLLNQLTILENTARESITNLEKTKKIIEAKIQKIKNLLSDMYGTRDDLQNQIEIVEDELDSVPEYLIRYDNDGYPYEVDNPVYLGLQRKLSSLESRLSKIEQKIIQTENRLDKALIISHDVSDTMSSLGEAVISLVQEKNECRQLISDVDDIYRFTRQDGEYVIGKLSQIEAAIEEYIAVNMKLDNSLAYNRQSNISVNQMINLNINIAIDKSQRNEIIDIDLEPTEQQIKEKEYLDDNGNIYRIGDELVRNSSYQINGYKYETDTHGRIKSASGKLIVVDTQEYVRKMDDDISIIGKGYELETDDRGHVIGHQFNGSDGMENMIPQDMHINRSDYKLLETKLANHVKEGNDVNINIIPYYDPESRRPICIFYFYKINGVAHTMLFPNKKIEAL